MKRFKVWNMTTGEEFERLSEGIEDFVGENPYYRYEQIESHYDAILEKWFFYIRQTEIGYTNARDRHEIQILQVSLREE